MTFFVDEKAGAGILISESAAPLLSAAGAPLLVLPTGEKDASLYECLLEERADPSGAGNSLICTFIGYF